MDHAFEILRRYARSQHLRLADVARGLAEDTLNPATIIAATHPPGSPRP
ncbi:hypothetical protein ACTXG6_29280 [Pseudonocardia sp. Cha107L01]